MYPRDYDRVCTALTSSLSLNFHGRERDIKDTFPTPSKTDSQTRLLHHTQLSTAQVCRDIIGSQYLNMPLQIPEGSPGIEY